MIVMGNNENFEELLELKQQMKILKQQLSNETIINNEQVDKAIRKYPITWGALHLWGGVFGVAAYGVYFYGQLTKDGGTSVWRLVFAGLLMIFVGYFVVFWGNRGHSYFQVADQEFQHWSRFPLRKSMSIPVSKISYIEILKRPTSFLRKMFWSGRTMRVRYNTYDDLYVDTLDISDIICDLLRANPDIELKIEK